MELQAIGRLKVTDVVIQVHSIRGVTSADVGTDPLHAPTRGLNEQC